MGKLIISRKKEWNNKGRKFGVYIDGEKKDIIGNGEIKELEIEPGKHTLWFKVDWCSSPEVEIEIPAEKSKTVEVGGYKAARWVLPVFYVIFLAYFLMQVLLKQTVRELLYLTIPLVAVVLYYLTFGRKKFIVVEEL